MAHTIVADTTTQKAAIHNLSDEILSLIFDELETDSLKKARLVCKRWNPHCENYLFDTIVLWKTTRDWQRLNNICQTPHLARILSHIMLARTEDMPYFATFDEYRDAIPTRLMRKLPPLMLIAGVKLTPSSRRRGDRTRCLRAI